MAASLLTTSMFRKTIGSATSGTSGSRTSFSVNVAYVHGVSGAAVAIRYFCATADTIDELYIFLDATTGTRENVTMVCDIYNEHGSAISQAGTTLRDSSTATVYPDADDKWIKFTFGTPYTPTVGEILWLVAYNTASVPGTDFPQIMSATNTIFSASTITGRIGYTTPDGFASGATAAVEMPFVVKQGSNYFGQPYTQFLSTPFTNNTLKRGIAFTISEDVNVCGIEWASGASLYNGINIFDSSTGPGGSPLYSYALGTDANESREELAGYKIFDTPITLTGPASYKVVMTYGSNYTNPSAINIEDYVSYSSVFDAMMDGFALCQSCIDDGAGGWTLNTALLPTLQLVIHGFPTISGGSQYLLLRTADLF